MSMPITANTLPAQPLEAPGATAATLVERPAEITTRAEARTQFNASILQASIEVSISTQNEPLALLLKSAIEGINALLKPEFGDNALENAVSQDNTPAGTAGRIVSISTGFFELYRQQHAGEDAAEVLKNFMTTIRSGFEQGFNEARDILQGMQVLSGDIASNIAKTYDLVQQGYAEFEAAQGSAKAAAASAPA